MGILAFLGGLVGIVVFLTLSALFNGYALTILWGWFMVPIFHLPQLALAPAIGIALVIGFLTHQSPEAKKKENEPNLGTQVLHVVLHTILEPSIVLLIGYIVHSFM